MATPLCTSNIAMVYTRMGNDVDDVAGVDGKRNVHKPVRTRKRLISKIERHVVETMVVLLTAWNAVSSLDC